MNGLMEMEIVDKDGNSKLLSFMIPSLSKPSIYHEPSSLGSMALTEGALCQHDLIRVIYSGLHPQRDIHCPEQGIGLKLNSWRATALYNLAAWKFLVILKTLVIWIRLCVSGFPRQQLKAWSSPCIRVLLEPQFMVQMLAAVYHAIYNGEWDAGREALDDILYRAQLELYSEPLLLGNAMKSSLPDNAPDGSQGRKVLQVEVTPSIRRISHCTITAASIRRLRWKREIVLTSQVMQSSASPSSPADTPHRTQRLIASQEGGALSQSHMRCASKTMTRSYGRSGGSASYSKGRWAEREDLSSGLIDADEGFVRARPAAASPAVSCGRKSRPAARRTSSTSLDCRPGQGSGAEARRYSILSLQEQHLPEETELLSPGKQSRSPSFNMQIISQV
ncbi:protein FAM126B-like [Puntigrus tetrazona]|uniref:protein FAM126B-like n=1 Tax=Puntigrus tetrazona TaxID=1606681 RepID=UPI001C8A7222|nr:protein FAM126B-like [Puntigrus tetrazona]